MNRLYFLTPLLLSIGSCLIAPNTTNMEFQDFSGIIVEEIEVNKKIYIQDIEDGSVVELLFYFDVAEDLHFDEFDYVEASGIYNKSNNTLRVESIYPSHRGHRGKNLVALAGATKK